MVNSALMLTSRAFVCAAVLIMTIYSAELLPTQVRNTGFGFLMTCARMGSIIAPYTGKTLVCHQSFRLQLHLQIFIKLKMLMFLLIFNFLEFSAGLQINSTFKFRIHF